MTDTTDPHIEKIVRGLELQREGLAESIRERPYTVAQVVAMQGRVKNQLENVTVEWLDDVAAIYAEACLDVRAMQKLHGRVLSTCQFGVLMPYPAKGFFSRLRYIDEALPCDEIIESLDSYDPETEIVLLMVRSRMNDDETRNDYAVFRLPRLKPR